MKESEKNTYRSRPFTYYEITTFAHYYHAHHGEASIDNLLISFFRWKEISKEFSITTRRLLTIEEAVIRYYGLDLAEVRGERRYVELVRARQVIAYLACEHASENFISDTLKMKRCSVQSRKAKCGVLLVVERQLRDDVAKIRKRLIAPFQTLAEEQIKLEEKSLKLDIYEQPEDKRSKDANTGTTADHAGTD